MKIERQSFDFHGVAAGLRRGGSGGAHVDLARHRGGDERGAEFLEAVDGVADLGDEGVDPRRLAVEEGGDGALAQAPAERRRASCARLIVD